MSKTFFAGASLAIAVCVGAANASPVTLEKTGSSVFDGNGVTGVRVEGGPRDVSASAGGFSVTDGISKFVAWCLDVGNSLSLPSEYSVTGDPFSNTGSIADKVGTVKMLFDTAYKSLDITDNAQSAGFQLALWEILYAGSGTLDIDGGTFEQVRTTTAALAANDAAQDFLDGLAGPVTGNFKLTFWESAVEDGVQLSQNLVTVSAVPVPAAAGLLLAGVAALGAVRARKKKS